MTANFDWSKMKNIQKIHRVLYAIGLGRLIGRIILLLTTTGRKSGLKRVTPLQYEKIGADYYVGARVESKRIGCGMCCHPRRWMSVWARRDFMVLPKLSLTHHALPIFWKSACKDIRAWSG